MFIITMIVVMAATFSACGTKNESADKAGKAVSGQSVSAKAASGAGVALPFDNMGQYESMGDLVMALNSEKVDVIEILRECSDYLIKCNPDTYQSDATEDKEKDASVYSNVLQMALLEKKESLRDEISKAIDGMDKDGSLKKCYEQYITNAAKDIKGGTSEIKVNGATESKDGSLVFTRNYLRTILAHITKK